MGIFNFFSKDKKEKLDKGLEKTKENVFGKLSRAIAGKSKIDEASLDDIEEALISSDIGVETTLQIIDLLEKRVASDKYLTKDELYDFLKKEIINLISVEHEFDYEDSNNSSNNPYVIMVVGVNGVGKTTTIGKLDI